MLFGVEVPVAALLGVELLVRAALDDAPRFDDKNLLRASNRGETVCNHESRATLHQPGKSFLNQRF
jgi:hypothetical protein